MLPIQLFDPESCTFTYLLIDEATRQATLIDPVDAQLDRDLAAIKEHDVRLAWVVETHEHADHITSAGKPIEHTGAQAATPAGCGIASAGRQLEDGDKIIFGQELLTAIHTSGHSAGSMSFLCRDHVFTGYTLLIDGGVSTDVEVGSCDAFCTSVNERLCTVRAVASGR